MTFNEFSENQASLFSSESLEETLPAPSAATMSSSPEKKVWPYTQVLLYTDSQALDKRTFTYLIPPEMQDILSIGTPVAVPFGRLGLVPGFVVGFTAYVSENIRLKTIGQILDEYPLFDLPYLQFLDWVATYTACSLSQVIACALPSDLLKKSRRKIVLYAQSPSIAILKVSEQAQYLWQMLQSHPNTSVALLPQKLGWTKSQVASALAVLERAGQLKVVTELLTEKPKSKMERWVSLPVGMPESLLAGLTPKQKAAWVQIQALCDPAPQHQVLLKSLPLTSAMVKKLETAGVLQIVEKRVFRNPLLEEEKLLNAQQSSQNTEQSREQIHYCETRDKTSQKPDCLTLPSSMPQLSDSQQACVDHILNSACSKEPFLLHGVTGSGKTEVYMELAEKTMQQGKSVLILLPEIALTAQIGQRFVSRFGSETLAIWHSNLSTGERLDTWRRIQEGTCRLVIGARSAIFAPVQQLGLVILDECHDDSYKQETPAPRYDARVLARFLGTQAKAKVVFGSATPEVAQYYEAVAAGTLLELMERFGSSVLPKIHLVDMKQYPKMVLSKPLRDAVSDTLAAGEQAILLMNRRGFFTMVMCKECDEVFQCPHCSVALTVHRTHSQVRCHYCGYAAPLPDFCKKCASRQLIPVGTGTQRVEEELGKLYPEARILRLDRDIMQSKDRFRQLLRQFRDGEADILVGTQMVAKGLDMPLVTLVGVLGADGTFALPEYKSMERGFQLMTQVAGRAGRREKPGRVYIQALDPAHWMFQLAKKHDYTGFYEIELQNRQKSLFPPYSQLFRFLVSGVDLWKSEQFIKAFAMNLNETLKATPFVSQFEILGPAPCLIERVQNRFRFHLLIKNTAGELGHRWITQFYQAIKPPEDLNFFLDVDSQSLL